MFGSHANAISHRCSDIKCNCHTLVDVTASIRARDTYTQLRQSWINKLQIIFCQIKTDSMTARYYSTIKKIIRAKGRTKTMPHQPEN